MIFNSTNYFFVFYSFYLEALQKRFVISIIQIFMYFVEITAKLLAIFVFRSFILYLIFSVAFILLTNVICAFYVYGKEPYLLKKSKINLPKPFCMAGSFFLTKNRTNNTIVRITARIAPIMIDTSNSNNINIPLSYIFV